MSAVDMAVADIATTIHGKLAAAEARGYEAGFKAGHEQARREQASAIIIPAETLDQLLDELQLFRQQFNVNDSRYLALGEILGRYAKPMKPSASLLSVAPLCGYCGDPEAYHNSETGHSFQLPLRRT